MQQSKIIIWFRRDLRIQDNLALWSGIKQGIIVPVFIWSPEEETKKVVGEAASWWLHHSLIELNRALQDRGSKLIIRKGRTLPILKELIEETGAKAVFFNERYEPRIRLRDQQMKEALEEKGIMVKAFHSNLLFPPLSIVNNQGQPYKVFTSFWKKCLQMPIPLPKILPATLSSTHDQVKTLNIDELGLLTTRDWYQKFKEKWLPGEKGAIAQWEQFIEERLSGYSTKRDYPYVQHVSRLSPHLTWGEISPRWIWHQVREQEKVNSSYSRQKDIDGFLRQLVWREFGYHQLVSFPEMIDSPLRKEFAFFPWEEREDEWAAWKEGRTGYPIIDAGMRELWETGWMHNRVRMVTASFLVKHLLIPWQRGASWFEETLLDADLANNSMGWQWVSGCGFDAAPYFRIFNPITQGQKFDESGDYIRQWVPELKYLPTKYLFSPWTAPETILREAGVELGTSYPFPIVEHVFARERALEAYNLVKK
ncbi:deoxyribodipyrimidine photo-lyase [Bacillus sp. SORGH_AS 510]|uniref:cryptochrome/photolyase family protein n=1 Tax=Bacillus sp. SORGH_AS_0510 TaxID=3041771 RepID=UPI00277DDACD|nr:deoxyribodipyrimidine photo-lyase [Bacillus sp. SORGH_AS_0510]MDQ1146650.1 deoxyribodipyrimidine photo-lyase [Bacillus sp. SORGH_AS_0510]